ncbi:MAG: ABC transporter substrate-binding protein [Bacteroidales bacterium]|nr:ABC transporter substrate-binding protein [Bacteroidales bacterium]
MGIRVYTVILIITFISACSSDQQSRRNVFRYNESKGIPTLDPAFARNQTIIWPVNQLFNGLVQFSDSMHIKPCIASSWNITGDGLMYTFQLRDDVYFHDHPVFPQGKGRRVIAEDFVYSLSRIVDPEVASPGAWIFQHVDKENPDGTNGFYAPDDTTFVVFLKDPFPAFIGILSMPYCFVVPEEIVEHYGDDFRNHPVGTGPFSFKVWREDEKLVMLKNPGYFEKDTGGNYLPYLDGVSITFIKDKQSEFMEFMLGNIDFLSGVHKAYKDELITRNGNLNPKYDQKIRLLSQPYLNTEYLGFLVDSGKSDIIPEPLFDPRIRQAINYGFDRVRMMKYLRNNVGTPAVYGFVPEGIPSFSPDKVHGYSYQPDRSRSLLIEAGYPNGDGLEEITLTTTSDYLDLCEFIQHELGALGIKIQIDVNTGVAFRSRMANAQLAFFRGSWIADYPDAENYLSLFYSKNFSPAGPNYTHYSNPEFDRLFEKALTTSEDSLRYPLYLEMDQIIMDEAVIVPLYYDRVLRFIPKDLKGLGSNPMNLLSLKYAFWSTNIQF